MASHFQLTIHNLRSFSSVNAVPCEMVILGIVHVEGYSAFKYSIGNRIRNDWFLIRKVLEHYKL